MYKYLNEYNLTGFDILFVYLNDVTSGLFSKMFLFSIFCIFAFGLFYMQKRTIGTGDITVALAVSSTIVTIIAILMRLTTIPLVDTMSVGICFASMLIFVGLLFFDDERT